MAISYVASATDASSLSGDGTASFVIPATAAVGDFMVAVFGMSGSSSTQPSLTTTPTGWTLLDNQSHSAAATQASSYLYARICQAGDAGSTVSVVWNATYRNASVVSVFRGTENSSVANAYTSLVSTNTGTVGSTSVSYPAITTTVDNSWVLRIGTAATTGTQTAAITFTAPSGSTEATEAGSTNPANVKEVGVCINYKTVATATTEASINGTSSASTTNVNWSLAIQPPVVTATPATGAGLLGITASANNALRFPDAGSGALTLTATGTWQSLKLATTGTAAYAFSGAGTILQGGAAQLTLTGAVTHVPAVTGQAASITLTAAGVVQALRFPTTAPASIVLTGAGTGPVLKIATTGAGATTLTSTASAGLRFTQTGNGFYTLTGLANYTLRYPLTGAGVYALTGLALPTTLTPATGAGSITLTGVANRLVPNTITSGWVWIVRSGAGNWVWADTLDFWFSHGYQIGYPAQPGSEKPESSAGSRWVTRNNIGYNSNPALNDDVWFPVWLAPGKWTLTATWGIGPNRALVSYNVSTNNGSTWTSVGTIDSYSASYGSSVGTSSQFTVPGTTVSKTLVRLIAYGKNASSSNYYIVHQGMTFTYGGP